MGFGVIRIEFERFFKFFQSLVISSGKI